MRKDITLRSFIQHLKLANIIFIKKVKVAVFADSTDIIQFTKILIFL